MKAKKVAVPETIKVNNGKGKTVKFLLNKFEKKIILDEVCYSQNYFPRISSKLDFKLGESDTIIDIGGNVGVFSIFAGSLAKHGKIYSFEPVKENFERLKYHKKLNKMNHVILENKGVSDKRKRVKIYLAKRNSGGHSLNKGKFKALNETIRSTEIIECITLKDIFDKYKIRRCDFLKIDCEGEETRILTGFPSSYFKRIDKIALEFHPQVNEIKLAKFLVKQGFRVTISNLGDLLGMIFAKKRSH